MAYDKQSVDKVELEKLRNSGAFLNNYAEGKERLAASGLINFLRIFARPFLNDGGANIYGAAHAASFCQGYNQALDDMMYFEELYLSKQPGGKPVVPTFGALGIAMAKGDIKKGDL